MSFLYQILIDPAWQGIGVLIAIIFGFIGFYYARRQRWWLYITGAFIILFIGLSIGAEAQRQQMLEDRTAVTFHTATIRSNLGWQSTGIAVRKGEHVTFQASSGQWKIYNDYPVTFGEGLFNNCRFASLNTRCTEPMPTFCTGSIIAQIGNRVYGIGQYATIIAQDDGDILLRTNEADEFLEDNEGSIIINVAVAPSILPSIERTVQVNSVEKWQTTGVFANEGDSITVEIIGGEWSIDQDQEPYTPGVGTCYTCTRFMASNKCSEPLPNFYTGALIAKIGDQIVGVNKIYTFTARRPGEISLRINDADDYLIDNDGKLTVRVTVQTEH